jgi:hypothetical protein
MSIAEIFGGENPESITKKLLAEIEKLGATRMEASYSGGNDEGGVTDIRLFNGQTPVEAPADEHPLWEAADDLLSTEYGTWAGEFHASGILHANVNGKRAWTEGTYETYDDTGMGQFDVSLS